MKISAIATVFAASVGLASAAPAVLWKAGSTSSGPSHVSDAADVESWLSSSIGGDAGARDASALAAVVFLVDRAADGSEGLSSLSASGGLPGVREKYGSADEVRHHVEGVESSGTVARDARKAGAGDTVAEVSLDEFRRKLDSMAQTEAVSVEGAAEGGKKVNKAEQRRRRAISEADVLVVKVPVGGDVAGVDAAIVAAIESPAVRNVVLSSVRSTDEVKRARKLAIMEKFTGSGANRAARASSSRRLEDEANNENQNNQNAQNQEGVYYVNMTPNIFAGILFFFFFVFTAYLGLTCMNMIEGQDVYVKKMPHIGREV